MICENCKYYEKIKHSSKYLCKNFNMCFNDNKKHYCCAFKRKFNILHMIKSILFGYILS